MDSCGRMDREDTAVGREENNEAFSCEIDELFVDGIETGKHGTGFENKSELKECIVIENVNTDECINFEDIETGEDLKHAYDKDAIFAFCPENEYSEIQAHRMNGKDPEHQLNEEDHKEEESVVEEVDTESVFDENYNSLSILAPGLENPSMGSEIRKILSSNIYLKLNKSKHKKHALWFLLIFSGLTLTVRMVSISIMVFRIIFIDIFSSTFSTTCFCLGGITPFCLMRMI